ncbi:MAG: NAD-dependent malic enzyme, partial [Bacteroidota bacterium]
PGMFRGALACRATDINEEMKMAAAYAIADSVETVYPNYIIPSVFDKTVVDKVAEAVEEAAFRSGVARRRRR